MSVIRSGVLASALLLVACATPYQDVKTLTLPTFTYAGGYWDHKGPGKLIQVGFSGNGYITREKVSAYLLYHSAEVAKREGAPYFALYGSLTDANIDHRISEVSVGTLGGKPSGAVYILPFSSYESGLLTTEEVLARLQSEIPSKNTQ